MIKNIVNELIIELLEDKIIRPEERGLYEYGLELAIVSLLNAVWIIGVSLVFRCPALGIIYVLILGSVRTKLGGYHAKSYGACFFCYNIFFVVSYLLCKALDVCNFSRGMIIVAGCFYAVIIYLFAPVTRGNILDRGERRQARNKAVFLTAVWIAISVVIRYRSEYSSYSIVVVLGLSVLLMMTEKMKGMNKGR